MASSNTTSGRFRTSGAAGQGSTSPKTRDEMAPAEGRVEREAEIEQRQARSGKMDAIEMLERQHRKVEQVFQQIRHAHESDRDVRPHLLELADLITTHTVIEERHFYPSVRAADTEDLIEHSFEDHDEVKRVILHILDAGPADPEFQAKLEELEGLIEAHVVDEEQELFPLVRKLCEPGMLDEVAEEMLATMADLQQEAEPRQVLLEDVGTGAQA